MVSDTGPVDHLKLMHADAAFHSIRRLTRLDSRTATRSALLRAHTEIDLIAKSALVEINRSSR